MECKAVAFWAGDSQLDLVTLPWPGEGLATCSVGDALRKEHPADAFVVAANCAFQAAWCTGACVRGLQFACCQVVGITESLYPCMSSCFYMHACTHVC